MWVQSLGQMLKLLIAVSVIFCVSSAGIFFLRLSSGTKNVSNQAIETLQIIQQNVTDMKEMTNATLYQVGDVSHETANMVRMERDYVQQESKLLVQSNKKLNQTLDQLQLTVKHVDQGTQSALAPIPDVLTQAQTTLLASQHTMEETQRTIADVGITVQKLQPAADSLSGTMEHLDLISASLNKVVDNATKPKPWYKQMIGYIWAPIKIVAIFAK